MAVVLTYNKKKLLHENVKCLLEQNFSGFDILIVDNNSSDGTKDSLKEYLNNPRINYVNTGANLGGAGGFSYGIEYAVKQSKYDYLWVMDDDTMPQKSSLEELNNAAQLLDNDFGYLCSQVLFTDGSLCNMNKQIVDKDWFRWSTYLDNGLLKVNKASFVSVFINAKAILDVGLPISEFFIWYDDTEYTARISKKYPSFLVSNSKVVHKMKSNMSLDITNDTPERMNRYKLAYRNYYYIARREGLKAKVRYYLYILRTIKNIFKSQDKRKLRKTGVVIKSVIDGWFFRPKIKFVE